MISWWYFCCDRSLTILTTTLPIAHYSHKKTINLDAIKKNAKFSGKFFSCVTVYVKSICYNGLENMKSAIRNLKSEMAGPYMSNPSVIIPTYRSTPSGYRNQFPLTFRGVKCKQHSAVFPNEISSFNPVKERGFEMVYDYPKPRYSEQMEGGVFVIRGRGESALKIYGIRSGIGSKALTIII